MIGLLSLLFSAALACAGGPPLPNAANVSGSRLPALAFEDLAGQKRGLRELAGLPMVMLPIYARCGSACPRNASALKQALLQSEESPRALQVFLFSIDENDTLEELRDFQRRLRLPASWILGRLSGPADIRSLTGAIDFRFARAGGEWEHPNAVAFLSPELRITGYLYGTDYSAAQLSRALAIARGSTNWSYKIGPYLLTVSVLGLTLSTMLLTHLLSRKPAGTA